ncbi:hypothetical protein BC567DRAFT_224319 [Phyllosticta citribraziliensis]
MVIPISSSSATSCIVFPFDSAPASPHPAHSVCPGSDETKPTHTPPCPSPSRTGCAAP